MQLASVVLRGAAWRVAQLLSAIWFRYGFGFGIQGSENTSPKSVGKGVYRPASRLTFPPGSQCAIDVNGRCCWTQSSRINQLSYRRYQRSLHTTSFFFFYFYFFLALLLFFILPCCLCSSLSLSRSLQARNERTQRKGNTTHTHIHPQLAEWWSGRDGRRGTYG